MTDAVVAYLTGVNALLAGLDAGQGEDDLLRRAVEILAAQTRVGCAAAFMRDPETGELERCAAVGSELVPARCPLPRHEAVRQVVVRDAQDDTFGPIMVHEGLAEVVACPIHCAGVIEGVLIIGCFQQSSPALLAVDETLANAIGALIAGSRKQRRLYDALMDAPANIAVMRGPEHIYEFTSRRYLETLHKADLVGQPFGRAIPDVGDEQRPVLDRVLKTGEPFAASAYELHTPDGRRAYFNFVFSAIRQRSGPNVGVLLHGVDVTDMVEARAELMASKRLFEQLVQDVSAIVWEVDMDTFDFCFVNAAAEALTGYPRAEWLSEGFWSKIMHPDDRSAALDYCRTHLAKDDDFEFEYRILTRDGAEMWIQDIVHVERYPDGAARMLRGLMIDITARKEGESEQRRMQQKLLDVQKLESLGVLAGGIAHDFNNLLTGMLGNASLAQLSLPSGHPVRSRIDSICTAAQRAADLTQQLLAYSGKGHFQVGLVDLNQQLGEIVDLLETTIPKKVQLRLEKQPALPLIEADASQMQQVFMNLAHNGAEAIGDDRGTVLVVTSEVHVTENTQHNLFQDLEPGRYVTVEVSDTGSGMSAEVQRRLFDPFYTTKERGRGLGLAAVLGIIRGHRGAIRIYSTEGEGTTFKVYLPMAAEAGEVRPVATLEPIRGGGTVLIVDDEEDVRVAARFMLEHLGFQVIEASDGRAGVALFREYHSELCCVLLDMTMPEMNGEEVFRAVRVIDGDVPVVLSSGYNEVEATRRFTGKGLAGFLQKPYTIQQLAKAMSATTS